MTPTDCKLAPQRRLVLGDFSEGVVECLNRKSKKS
jgi:hypothetical protein